MQRRFRLAQIFRTWVHHHRLPPGDLNGGELAEIKPRLSGIAALGRIHSYNVQTQLLPKKESARQMVSLGHQNRGADPKDIPRPVQAVVGPKAREVADNIFEYALFRLYTARRLSPPGR